MAFQDLSGLWATKSDGQPYVTRSGEAYCGGTIRERVVLEPGTTLHLYKKPPKPGEDVNPRAPVFSLVYSLPDGSFQQAGQVQQTTPPPAEGGGGFNF